jgi:hypothetical protein
METQVIIHLMPHEIDWFEWQAKQLKVGSVYIEDKVIVDVTLNLNLVNWKDSQIPKQYFIDRFNQIRQLFGWCETIFEINENNTCLGIDDKRRDSIRKYNSDNFVYLDCDIVFKPETLALLINSAKTINDDYYIVSPQTTKLWDFTWDVLVNNLYLDKQYGFEKLINPYSILNTEYGEISLSPINVFKFGGGWFNLISAKLLKFTDIPDSFGPYGIDDTYIMYCCDIMKQKGMTPQQYVVNNLVVAEDYKFRNNLYNQYLSIINKKDEYRIQAESNFQIELNKFYEKIHSNNNN